MTSVSTSHHGVAGRRLTFCPRMADKEGRDRAHGQYGLPRTSSAVAVAANDIAIPHCHSDRHTCADQSRCECQPETVRRSAFSVRRRVYSTDGPHQVIDNPEVKAMQSTLLGALVDPTKKTLKALDTLLKTSFVHYIDASSLALVSTCRIAGVRHRLTASAGRANY